MLIAAVFVLSACSTWDSFRQTFITKPQNESVPTITIGVIEPQTGRYAGKGKDEIKGIELANSIYNNVDGYDVKLVKVDTQSTVAGTETAIQALVEMKPVAIIGTAAEASSLTIGDYIDEAQIPTITPSASNPLITQRSRYYFRASLTESQMGEGLAEYAAEELGSRSIAVISIKNDTSTSALLDGFDDRIKKIAGKRKNAVAYSAEISGTDEEIEKALKSIKKKEVDVCFAGLGTEAMDKLFTKAEELGLTDVIFMGTRSWGNSDFISMMEKHPDIKVVFPYESVLTGTSQASGAQTEEAQRFSIEYNNRYGDADIPSEYAALGYDSYLILINAIYNAKSQDGKDICDAIRDLEDLKCSTGTFSFDDRGNVIREVNLSTIKDGKAVSEYVTTLETEAKSLDEIEQSEQ